MLVSISLFFFFNDTATTEIYTLSLHDALPISPEREAETQRERIVPKAATRDSLPSVQGPALQAVARLRQAKPARGAAQTTAVRTTCRTERSSTPGRSRKTLRKRRRSPEKWPFCRTATAPSGTA